MSKKLTIDLGRMSKGWNNITQNEYDYCFYKDPKSEELFELQLIKINFPSSKVAIEKLIDEKTLTN